MRTLIITDRESLAKQGDNALGSVRPSMCLSELSGLPSAEKSDKSYCQSRVFVCVSVIRGCVRIIARMWLIGF